MIIRSRNGPKFLFKHLGRQLQYHWFLKQVEHGFPSFFAKCLPDSMIFQSFVLARETNNDISLSKSFKREIDQLLQKESLLLNGAQLILEAGTMPLLVIFFSINSCIVRCWLLIYVIEEGIPCNILI